MLNTKSTKNCSSAHIFFDDAMDAHDLEQMNYKVNDFVKLLVKTVDKAAR